MLENCYLHATSGLHSGWFRTSSVVMSTSGLPSGGLMGYNVYHVVTYIHLHHQSRSKGPGLPRHVIYQHVPKVGDSASLALL